MSPFSELADGSDGSACVVGVCVFLYIGCDSTDSADSADSAAADDSVDSATTSVAGGGGSNSGRPEK